METLISAKYIREHYHDASRHGPGWTLLNKILHAIVLIYTLFGMIRFKVKFIHMEKLVKALSFCIIFHSFYLTLKFGYIALSLYRFNIKMDSLQLAPTSYNCSMADAAQLLQVAPELSPDFITYLLARRLPVIGGPFKLLGNRATLMFGFYSFSVLIMLAIFPIELLSQDIAFNYIRFVLGDTKCLEDMYEKRQRQTDQLANWSLYQNNSSMTVGTKKMINLRELRCMDSDAKEDDNLLPPDTLQRGNGRFPHPPVWSIRHSFVTNHTDKPDYNVQVASKNLEYFKPYVRSEDWFKLSMVIYPMFILYYFGALTLVVSAIATYFIGALKELSGFCGLDLFANWTFLDKLTFFESLYMIFAISCTISFYTSYYFGTIMELYVWLQELDQQLNLYEIILKLTSRSSAAPSLPAGERTPLHNAFVTDQIENYDCPMMEALLDHHNLTEKDINYCYNQFGGIDSLKGYLKLRFMSQSQSLKRLELMGFKLISKRQTVFRATVINMNLFFEELHDTRHMATTIVRRTLHIAVSLATMAALTRSQFQLNYINLTALFGACLIVLNLYFICGALINSQMNKMIHKIHRLVAVAAETSTDHDLLEFWLRYIRTYGVERDKMCYKILGYGISWENIITLNSVISSAYFFTMDN